ncbi:hypothetical protein MHU86_14002 [Fragilaria crotonensis]|nr:hypothetical protein MHU86_14002 [Fragilaria crotonensis]
MPPPPVWNSASVATSTRRSFPLQRSTNPFLDEQAAKRAEIERARDEQLAKLKALNSPLPSGRPQGLVPAMAPSPPAAAAILIRWVLHHLLMNLLLLNGGGNGFMGRIFGGNDEQTRNEPQPEPQRKIVRQPLPAVDEDEEFEAFSRNGPNKNMSIKDALQNSNEGGGRSKDDQENKSKMWGVDMSRFND